MDDNIRIIYKLLFKSRYKIKDNRIKVQLDEDCWVHIHLSKESEVERFLQKYLVQRE